MRVVARNGRENMRRRLKRRQAFDRASFTARPDCSFENLRIEEGQSRRYLGWLRKEDSTAVELTGRRKRA